MPFLQRILMEELIHLAKKLMMTLKKRVRPVVALSLIVAFSVTYLLILPAITLGRDAAEVMGGVAVSSDESSGDSADGSETVEENAPDVTDTADDESATPPDSGSSSDQESASGAETEESNEPEDTASGEDAEKQGNNDEKSSGAVPAGKEEKPDAAEDKAQEKSEDDIRLEKRGKTADGRSYKVTVTCGAGSGVPDGADLAVSEITPESEPADDGKAYDEYVAETETALGWEAGSASYIRLFDISIIDSNDNKVEIQAPVDVKIELADKENTGKSPDDTHVVHFADGADEPEIVQNVSVDGGTVSFEAEGFSAYAIVDGPEPSEDSWIRVNSIEDLDAHASDGIYMFNPKGYYFRNDIVADSKRSGIGKTKPATSYPPDEAAKYYFEKKAGTTDQYYIYCYDDNGDPQYIRNANNNSLSFTNAANKTAFTAEVDADGNFTLKNGQWYINMQGGDNGTRFCAYNTVGDVNNNLNFVYHKPYDPDPYDLDGKEYGLMNWNGGAAGKAMMAASSIPGALDIKAMTVLSKTGDHDNKLFVPSESDITMWKFHWAADDKYYLTATVDGSVNYLKIDGNGLSLVPAESEATQIQVKPGTGIHEGQICLKADGYTLTYSGDPDTGFNTGGSTGSEWLYFAEESELTDDYTMTHSAVKISVSDPHLDEPGKDEIVIYTRFWDDKNKRYQFYVLDHDGTLVPCTENGDSIEWTGGIVNTKLWKFTEYKEGGQPTYYYELQNEYSGKYIAPQITGDQILSDSTIGINLNGRRLGHYYSTILAWDDINYSYAGLKVNEDGDAVETCIKADAMDFYFARWEELPVADNLHTVPTIDNTKYGITMKMVDIDTRAEMSNFLGNDEGGIGNVLHQGLLSTDLNENGYPTAVGGTLDQLYAGESVVNHLFIESTYKSSGYYEFDSTQNFASLNEETGNFEVYKELGTHDESSRNTLKHGQFYPYNQIEPGEFASLNRENLYSATAQLLKDSDPRKYEQLYLIKKPDYYYAMELEASFIQTPSGLDAWGHDIIYEFTGDDDFWLYVDGELVIDLGGIHSAVPGSVNFRTGQVNVNGVDTTLRDLFYQNYKKRGHTDAEAQAYVDGIFVQNSDGQWVFKDNTGHTMRIFYMERGAGAANLHMRFNLASIKPGTALLGKELAGVDEEESVLAEFAYQIKYKKKDGTEHYLTNTPNTETDTDDYVFYQDTDNPVPFYESMEIDGVTYENVFMLKAGEYAEVNFPTFGEDNEEIASYEIIECCVNTDVYERVTLNSDDAGADVPGTEIAGHPNRKDYNIGYASTKDRPYATYRNHVDPHALRDLTVTKKLYDETGQHELHGDPAVFNYRLYLATEFDSDINNKPADLHTYHVKDENDNYCRRDPATQTFISIGKTNYADLTPEERKAVTFNTSMNGSITKIPAFYTVEVRGILAGTQYRLEERPGEVPDGYSYRDYTKDETARIEDRRGVPGVVDTVVADKDPHVDVNNLKGWGLRVNKIWTDKEFMSGRDATYFAVFTDDGSSLTLVDGSVRQLKYGEESLYWYYRPLPVTGVPFDNYEIREVKLTNPVVDEEGNVSYDSLEILGDGASFELNGTQKGESTPDTFRYTVLYDKGTVEQGSNVRTDKATNNRPGIVLRKESWSAEGEHGAPLEGATFTLKDSRGETIGTFASDETGLITVAFLGDDTNYTLTETSAPQGYHGLEGPMTIRLNEGTDIKVSGIDSKYYVLEQNEGSPPTLTIKNRPYQLKVVKEGEQSDGSIGPLSNVHFELHRETTQGGITIMDPAVLEGYEDLVSGSDGTIPQLDNTLTARVYYLKEIAALGGYDLLSPVRFQITPAGAVVLTPHDNVEIRSEEQSDDTLLYTITLTNRLSAAPVAVKKVSYDNTAGTEEPLGDVGFTVYRAERDGSSYRKGEKLYDWISAQDTGMLFDGSLQRGAYLLEEKPATTPDGYHCLTGLVWIEVSASDVNAGYLETSGIETVVRVDKTDPAHPVVIIRNTTGVELPMTGGPGTTALYMIGALLLAVSAVGLIARRRARS